MHSLSHPGGLTPNSIPTMSSLEMPSLEMPSLVMGWCLSELKGYQAAV